VPPRALRSLPAPITLPFPDPDAFAKIPTTAPSACPTGISLIATSLGFAFATTSYRANGLVVVDATHDVQRLVAKFRELYGPVGGKVFGVGASEGGLIIVLAAEPAGEPCFNSSVC
jgi:hypothetical protein